VKCVGLPVVLNETVAVLEPVTLPSGLDEVKVMEGGVTLPPLTLKGTIGLCGPCFKKMTGEGWRGLTGF
jgi:hypothetical protein